MSFVHNMVGGGGGGAFGYIYAEFPTTATSVYLTDGAKIINANNTSFGSYVFFVPYSSSNWKVYIFDGVHTKFSENIPILSKGESKYVKVIFDLILIDSQYSLSPLKKTGYGSSSVSFNLSENGAAYLNIPAASSSWTSMTLTDKVDIKDYKTLEITMRSRGYQARTPVGFCNSVGSSLSFVKNVNDDNGGNTGVWSTKKTLTLDISSLLGSYYFGTYQAGSSYGNGGEVLIYSAILKY